MSNLYILNYNNYYNRIVKKENTLTDYLKQDDNYQFLQDTNFNPEDGINTTHIVGGPVVWNDRGNYLITTDENNEIVSRWFIIESTRTRAGQYKLTLRRDLVVDYYNSIINSPMYVEKATVQDDDPAIWNNEGVSVNQIKTKEYLINDQSRSSWIVGYYDRKFLENDNLSIKEITINIKETEIPGDILTDLAISKWFEQNVALKKYVNNIVLEIPIITAIETGGGLYSYYSTKITLNADTRKWSTRIFAYPFEDVKGEYVVYPKDNKIPDYADIFSKAYPTSKIINMFGLYSDDIANSISKAEYNEILDYNGKTLESTSEVDFSSALIQIVDTENNDNVAIEEDKSTIDGVGALITCFNEILQGLSRQQITQALYPGIDYTIHTFDQSTYSRDKLKEFKIIFSTSANNLEDSPYNIFAIPYKQYNNIELYGTDNITVKNNPNVNLAIAQELAKQMGDVSSGGFLYDIQLLPFYPNSSVVQINEEGIPSINVGKGWHTGNENYTYSDSFYHNNINGFTILFPRRASGNINQNQLELRDSKIKEIANIPSITNKKIENECDLYRLCSPNYNGQFEFNAAKLDGITGFECDYTYLPYSPYIKLNPIFSGLYGSDFDDARGVNCQGDFSISYLSDKWISYQNSNKNYANIFNREIQNLEVQQEYERKQQQYHLFSNTLQGAAMGGMAGSSFGPVGSILGGAVGAASMLGSSIADLHYGEKLRAEALDYKTDMYNYQLDNIKAMPNSLAKVTAYTENNKIFPILEYYTCTDTEKRAIANKIAYNGMTVMRIGTMNEFINNKWSYNDIQSQGYIKGKLIRLIGIEEDYVIVNAISGELDKGVFIQ